MTEETEIDLEFIGKIMADVYLENSRRRQKTGLAPLTPGTWLSRVLDLGRTLRPVIQELKTFP